MLRLPVVIICSALFLHGRKPSGWSSLFAIFSLFYKIQENIRYGLRSPVDVVIKILGLHPFNVCAKPPHGVSFFRPLRWNYWTLTKSWQKIYLFKSPRRITLLDGSIRGQNCWLVNMRHSKMSGEHCTENTIYVFPEMSLRGIVPHSYIHVSVTDPGNI